MCDLPYNRHTLWEKEYDMVRLARASECEVNGVDICSAAFARRWRGFVVDVHRAFAILAQERAISLSLLLPLAAFFLAVSFSQLTPPMSTPFDPGFLVLENKTKFETDKAVGSCQSRKRLLYDDVLCTETSASLASSEDKVVAQITDAAEIAIGTIPAQDAHGQLVTLGQSSRPALAHEDRVCTVVEDGKPFPAIQSLVEHRPRCQCVCNCPRRPARGNRWRCTSHCEAMVCQSCVAEWHPVICHWCFNPWY